MYSKRIIDRHFFTKKHWWFSSQLNKKHPEFRMIYNSFVYMGSVKEQENDLVIWAKFVAGCWTFLGTKRVSITSISQRVAFFLWGISCVTMFLHGGIPPKGLRKWPYRVFRRTWYIDPSCSASHSVAEHNFSGNVCITFLDLVTCWDVIWIRT